MTDTYTPVLPREFRSGNEIPVERATITRERMAEILAEAIEAYQRWIKVTDLLPKPGATVIAYWVTSDPDELPSGAESSIYCGRNQWQDAYGDMDYHGCRRVSHWQPLPPPPESEQ